MRNAYAYVQPSAIEGLSPVILEAAYVGAPIICSDIPQNRYGIAEYGTYFRSGDVADLTAKLQWALDAPAGTGGTGCGRFTARRQPLQLGHGGGRPYCDFHRAESK